MLVRLQNTFSISSFNPRDVPEKQIHCSLFGRKLRSDEAVRCAHGYSPSTQWGQEIKKIL